MSVKLLTEHHLEFLSLKGGCRGSFDSTHVKMPHCWKSQIRAHWLLQREYTVMWFWHRKISLFFIQAPRKKNKKKRQQQQQQQQQNGPKSPQSVSSESSVKTNGDIGDMRLEPPIVNGILHIGIYLIVA